MISLPDVGLLIALFDPAHIHHDLAHRWFESYRAAGWATCAATENGFVATLSHPGYPGRGTPVADALERLRDFTGSGDHHFWPGSTSLRRASRVDVSVVESHEQIHGVYLLLLAVENEGRLVTFDDVPLAAVPRARPEQIMVLS